MDDKLFTGSQGASFQPMEVEGAICVMVRREPNDKGVCVPLDDMLEFIFQGVGRFTIVLESAE